MAAACAQRPRVWLAEADEQAARMREAVRLARAYTNWSLAPDDDDDDTVPAGWRPYEGYAQDATVADVFGTRRAYHDVAPDGGATTRRTQAAIGAHLTTVLRERGLMGADEDPRAFQQRSARTEFDVHCEGAPPMGVQVVNIVHATQCVGAGVTELFYRRRLMHVAVQENYVHRSLKVCYAPPFNKSDILFPANRVLETGSNNVGMARVLFEHVTLPFIRAAGVRNLVIQTRKLENLVATAKMPPAYTLDLRLLKARHSERVTYRPLEFPGAIICEPDAPRAAATTPRGKPKTPALLAFAPSAVVCVGTDSMEQLTAMLTRNYPLLIHNSRKRAGDAADPNERPRKRPKLIVSNH